VLEFVEEALDEITLTIQGKIAGQWGGATGVGRNHRGNLLLGEGLVEEMPVSLLRNGPFVPRAIQLPNATGSLGRTLKCGDGSSGCLKTHRATPLKGAMRFAYSVPRKPNG
jgi:hypothetical protein